MSTQQKELLVIDETNKKSYTLTVSLEEFDRANTEPGYCEVLLLQYLQKGCPIRMESIYTFDTSYNENILSNHQDDQPSAIESQKIENEPIDASCNKNISNLMTNNQNFEKTGRTIPFLKRSSKIDSLKRIYREKLDLKNKSDGKPITWPYFEVMHNIFHKERWVKPLSTAGSGLSALLDVKVANPRSKQAKPLNLYLVEMAVNRRLKQESDALKHREKMARLDRFNDNMESIAQSFNVIAAAKKAKLDRDTE